VVSDDQVRHRRHQSQEWYVRESATIFRARSMIVMGRTPPLVP
jgi:hypothetical protein